MNAAATPTLLRVISARECPQRFARESALTTESADMPARALERIDTVSAVSLGSAVVSTGTWAPAGNAHIITRKTTAPSGAARSPRLKKISILTSSPAAVAQRSIARAVRRAEVVVRFHHLIRRDSRSAHLPDLYSCREVRDQRRFAWSSARRKYRSEIGCHRVTRSHNVVPLSRRGRHPPDLSTRRYEHHAALAKSKQEVFHSEPVEGCRQCLRMIEIDGSPKRGLELPPVRLEDRRTSIREEIAVLGVDDDGNASSPRALDSTGDHGGHYDSLVVILEDQRIGLIDRRTERVEQPLRVLA